MNALQQLQQLGMYGQQNANNFQLGMQNANAYQNVNSYEEYLRLEMENKTKQLKAEIEDRAKLPEKKSMFKEIATDVKGFVLEHRSIIYFIAFALLLDHVFFKGAFKARLQGMADKIVAKVEEKI